MFKIVLRDSSLYLKQSRAYARRVGVMGGGTFFKVGGHKRTSKNSRTFLWFELATVTSQALKYDIIAYTHHLKV